MSHRVKLGKTGIEVSPICYGTWQLSPAFWGDQDREAIAAAMRRAFELGVNFYDTAGAYGDGLAETVTGEALAGLPRDQIVLCTKVYWHYPPKGERYADLSRRNVIADCEEALGRLRTDYLDVLLCHSFDALPDPAETIDGLETLVKQGKIRSYGTSNWTVEQMRMGVRAGGNFAVCQPPYSLINRAVERDVLPFCYTEDVGVMVYSPLQRGLLTGKYTGDETFDDHRKDLREFQGERFKQLCAAAAKIRRIGERHGLTTVQTVLAATLMHPAVHSAIVGIKRPEQIEEAAGAMGKVLTVEEYHRLRDLLRS